MGLSGTLFIRNATNTDWVDVVGAQGNQGNQGYQGTAGTPGGPQGDQGYQGNQGASGTRGTQGTAGSQGYQGYQGLRGYQGYQGYQGHTGVGFQGYQGYQGYQGGGGGHTIVDETTPLSQRANLTFKGDLVWAVDNPGDNSTDIIFSGSASAPGSVSASGTNIGARVYHDTNFVVTGSADIYLPFNSERWDTDNIHDTVTNNGRLTSNTSGTYLIVGSVQFASDYRGRRMAWIRLNGTTELARISVTAVSGTQTRLDVSTIYGLNATDYVELGVYQNIAGTSNLNVEYSANVSPEFMMQAINGVGPRGNQGYQGNQGYTGSVGAQGNQGTQGYQGHTGAQGTQGYQGVTGSQGFQGYQGHTGVGVQGYQGYQGYTGSQGFQGYQGHTGVGAQGYQGHTGATGPQGYQGHTGAGVQGYQGTQGYQGYQGHTGVGFQGYQGYQGYTGAQGYQGYQGHTGMGFQGYQGTQGYQGATGSQGAIGISMGAIVWFHHSGSDIAGYERLEGIPSDSGVEEDESITITGSAGSECLMDSYATLIGSPGVSSFPAGLWRFHGYHYVNNPGGVTQAVYKVYKRTTGGVESEIFSVDSDEINATEVTEYITDKTVTSGTAMNISDRIVVKVFGKSTTPGTVIHFVYEGSTHVSYIATTFGASQGYQGYQGYQGDQGYQGEKGTEVTGPQGYQGHTGIGFQGYQGHTGATGPQGYQGNTGSQGYQGYQGYQGATGTSGGEKPTGSAYYYPVFESSGVGITSSGSFLTTNIDRVRTTRRVEIVDPTAEISPPNPMLYVSGTAYISDDLKIQGYTMCNGITLIKNIVNISGTAKFTNDVTFNFNQNDSDFVIRSLNDDYNFYSAGANDSIVIGGYVPLAKFTLYGDAVVTGSMAVQDTLEVEKELSVGSTIFASGTFTTRGMIRAGSGLYVGNIAGAVGNDDIIADGDIRANQGMMVGFITGSPAQGYLWVKQNAFIGDTANAQMTQGLTINQGANDDEILSFKSSDIAHGKTTTTETDTFGYFQKIVAADGGVLLGGIAESATQRAIQLSAIVHSGSNVRSTASLAPIVFASYHATGTSNMSMPTGMNLLVIRNGSLATKFIFDAGGSAHADIMWTTFDDYDDVALLGTLETVMTDPLKGQFLDFLTYNRDNLEQAEIVHFDDENPGHAMLNTTRLSMLLVGAVRQLGDKLSKLENKYKLLLPPDDS